MTKNKQAVNNIIDPAISKIRHQMICYGYLWVSATAFILYITVGYYFLVDSTYHSFKGSITLMVTAVIALLGHAGFIHLRARDGTTLSWCLTALALTASLVLLAHFVSITWSDTDSAQKVLLIAFLVMLMGWNVNRAVLACGLLPTSSFYIYLTSLEPNIGALDIAVSALKFPFLVIVFYTTIQKFITNIESQFIEKIRTIEDLELTSQLDELTKIQNRRGFNFELTAAISHAKHTGTPLSIGIIDIDFFKQYNDSMGHPAGDQCLRAIANILEKRCDPEKDTVARIGGEEFAIIMPANTLNRALMIAKDINSAIANAAIPHPDSSISGYITASIGITDFKDTDSLTSIYERADAAMYQAKASGRNKIVASSSMHSPAQHQAAEA
ncbi:GGDEF domain-containing protein [Ferrimonas aestuarii]|uniref:diguanylate cyclase n=1 Tax=Ferrimonas aestuarii TaxID=2569539 RepID=A0A4U1BGJ6_9GAMM|nr:GGDEF domain-containing protein [Ferrimonas aestuarii]TKB50109.1 GGDEF domain-containing protein [Ferrimonas aestuarii]